MNWSQFKTSTLGPECQFANWICWIWFLFSIQSITDSSCLIAIALCRGWDADKGLCPFFDSVPFFLLFVDRCSHNVQEQSSSTAAASHTWMHAHQHIYMQASVLTRTLTTQSVFQSLPYPLLILPFFPPCTDVPRDRLFLFLISFIKVRFRTLLFSIGWLLSMGSVK